MPAGRPGAASGSRKRAAPIRRYFFLPPSPVPFSGNPIGERAAGAAFGLSFLGLRVSRVLRI